MTRLEGLPAACRGRPVYRANIGGPMSRTRRERVHSSLLGPGAGVVRMPHRRTLGLRFTPQDCAVDIMEALLRQAGLDSPEQLRARYALPAQPLLAAPLEPAQALCVPARSPAAECLEQALWLGLCTAYLFDPARPVLWTETSLRRCLCLCEPGGFYA